MISQYLLWSDIGTFVHKSFVLTIQEHCCQLINIYKKILDTHLKIITIFMIIIVSYPFVFMHFRHTEEFNQLWSSRLLYIQFLLAWMFTVGLFQAALVIMTHVNWETYDKWVPVTTARRFLRLSIEERPPMWMVATNILNKQIRTADKWWSSNFGVWARSSP